MNGYSFRNSNGYDFHAEGISIFQTPAAPEFQILPKVTTWDWATSGTAGHNGTHWRLKCTPIHMFNQDSTPIWSLQDSTPLHDSTPPFSTCPL